MPSPQMPPTKVMCLGALTPGMDPQWRTSFLRSDRTTPQMPQNLLTQSIQGASIGGLGDLVLTDQQVLAWEIGSLISASLFGALAFIHGYRRNNKSVGWGATWGVLGAMFPVVTMPVAMIEGFGAKK